MITLCAGTPAERDEVRAATGHADPSRVRRLYILCDASPVRFVTGMKRWHDCHLLGLTGLVPHDQPKFCRNVSSCTQGPLGLFSVSCGRVQGGIRGVTDGPGSAAGQILSRR